MTKYIILFTLLFTVPALAVCGVQDICIMQNEDAVQACAKANGDDTGHPGQYQMTNQAGFDACFNRASQAFTSCVNACYKRERQHIPMQDE